MQTTFGLIGSGRRTRFYLRLAAMAPDRFRVAGVVTRTAERGAEVTAQHGVPTFRSPAELAGAHRPDLMVASVPWAASPDAIRAVVALDLPVLAETPPAPDLDGLRSLWNDVGSSGLVQVAEQYLLMPGHAARLSATRLGLIGEVTSVQVSSTHQYHAVSMIRGLLGVGYESAVVSGRAFSAPLANPLTPQGWTHDLEPHPATTTLATMDFGGRMGLYDFTDNQWWNPLRTRRIVIRGSAGEISDDRVIRMTDPTTAVESMLIRRQSGIDLNLEGMDLHHISLDGEVLYRNPFIGTRMSDDDIAVAAILEATRRWAQGDGPAPYPLAQACQDHLLTLAIGESVKTGADVTATVEPWSAVS